MEKTYSISTRIRYDQKITIEGDSQKKIDEISGRIAHGFIKRLKKTLGDDIQIEKWTMDEA